MAELFHVSRQAVQKWENGSSVPDIDRLIDIARFFNVSLDTLLREEDPDTPLSEKIMHRLIKQGYIPTVHSGNKLYIDVDRVPEYLTAAMQAKEKAPAEEYGKIRPIREA